MNNTGEWLHFMFRYTDFFFRIAATASGRGVIIASGVVRGWGGELKKKNSYKHNDYYRILE